MMTKYVTIAEIEKLSRESARILYGDIRATSEDSSVSVSDEPIEDVSGNRSLSPKSNETIDVSEVSASVTPVQSYRRLENALRILRIQSSERIPFLLRSEVVTLAGVKGAATVLNAEKAALRSKYIVRHEIARARTKVVLWEITQIGYAALNVSKPKWKSKGDYRHKFLAYRIADAYKQKGYSAKIEYRNVDGKLIDVVVQSNDSSLYIEICASYPLEKELINLQKNLACGPLPSEIIFAVTERKMKASLSHILDEYIRLNPAHCVVRIVLAGDLIAPMEVGK
jgi:hypothetical protein